jgi:hypothetical protein
VADQVRPSSISGARVFSVLDPGHVGEERGRLTASSCRIGGDRGDQLVYELIQAGGIIASMGGPMCIHGYAGEYPIF